MSDPRIVDVRRRILLRNSAAVGAGALLAASSIGRSALAATSVAEVTEGPYFVDELLNRSDIRVDPTDGTVQSGLLMLLSVTVSTLDTTTGKTTPLPNAYVDIWHCNAQGLYSDESSEGTSGKKFLRGYQVSSAQGKVAFRTIYPGWYSGRCPHIHCKVREFAGSTTSFELNTQFFMDEQFSQLVYTDSNLPYASKGLPDQSHANDQVYTGTQGCIEGAVAGDYLNLKLARATSYVSARFDILIDKNARCRSTETGSGAGGSGGPSGGPSGAPSGGQGGTPPTPPTS